MTAISNTIRRLTSPFRWRHSRLTLAAILLLASVVFLGAGLAGLFLTSDTSVGEFVPPVDDSTALPETPHNDSPVARMIIEKIGVDATVIALGLTPEGVPEVPSDPYEVAWYSWSSKPGWGSNAVFSGHVDWTVDGQPVIGVFYYLRDLALDDVIRVVLEDGTEYSYKVTANRAVPDGDPEGLEVMKPTANDVVTIITCGGTWVANSSELPYYGHYTHRQVVQAELIEEEPLPTIGAAP
jgi:sortase (surface protein transpeptidase)